MKRKLILLWLLFVLIDVVLVFSNPQHPTIFKYFFPIASYNLSNSAAIWYDLLLLIPQWAIWYISFYSFSVLTTYSHIIKARTDGKGMLFINKGLVVISVGVVIYSLVAASGQYLESRNINAIHTTVIVSNYLSVIITLISFALFYIGANLLTKVIRHNFSLHLSVVYNLIFLMLSTIYTYSFLKTNSTSNNFGLYSGHNFLSYVSIYLPYIIAWFLGINAALLINYYKTHVDGIIYKKMLNQFSLGVLSVILGEIGIQLFLLLDTSINRLSLGSAMLISLLLMSVFGLGFVLIANGVNKLAKIESVD